MRVMSPSAGTLLDTALKLPREDRAKLASELIASLDGEAEAGVAAAWNAEVESRVREADAGKARLIDGKTVKAEVSRALKRG
jgi:putative addiction module component (TIGR02574 family)